MQLAMTLLKPVLEQRINKTKWVVLRWPTAAMAQMAGMSTEAFEDFYFKVWAFVGGTADASCKMRYEFAQLPDPCLKQIHRFFDRHR